MGADAAGRSLDRMGGVDPRAGCVGGFDVAEIGPGLFGEHDEDLALHAPIATEVAVEIAEVDDSGVHGIPAVDSGDT